jgi:PAS domain S-box-containing protein
MMNLIQPLWEASLFIPHGYCDLWQPELVGLHLVSDALIVLACYSIPVTLFYGVRRRRDLPFTWIWLLFSALIVACGTTHLMEIWTLWHPTYWLSGGMKLITAAIAWATAIALVQIIPQALALPSPAQLDAANQSLQSEITQRQQMNLALQASEARLAGILEIAEDAIISIAANQQITLFNQGAERIFGYRAAEAIGQPLDLLLPNPLATIHHQHVADFSQTPTISRKMGNRREIFGRRKDGTEFPAEASISKLQLGNEVIFTTFLRDITDRKRAEQAVQEQEAFLRAIGDNIPSGFLYQTMREPDGRYRFTYLSAGVERVTQLKPAAIVADACLLHNRLLEDDLSYITQQIEASAQNLSVFDVQVRERSPSGEIRWLRLCSTPRQLDNGRVVWDGIRLDINDLKQTEAALRQSQAKNRAMLVAIPDLLLRVKRDGTCLDFIPPTATEAGAFLPIQRHLSEILPADLLQHQLQRIEQALAKQELQIWEQQLLKDSQICYEEIRLVPCDTDEVLVIVRDISEAKRDEGVRKQAEKTLRRYERIVSATTDAISLIDRNYIYQVVNQTYIKWYNKPQDQIVGHSVSELIPMNIYETTVKPRLDQCLAGQVVQYEMWADYITPNPQFLSVTYNPYYDDTTQAVAGVVVSLHNITRLKHTEMELELQSLIVNNMAEGVCMVKVSDGTCVYANPKFEQMFGYDADELIGQHVAIVNYEDSRTHTTALYDKLARTILERGEATYEIHNVKKDDTSFWCQATTSVFEHPSYGAVFVVVQQDITERKQAQDQLRDLSNRLTLALKSGAIGTWDWDLTANHVTWDDRMCELYGIAPDQFTQDYEAWVNCLHPDDRPLVEAAAQQALAGEKDYEPEFRVRHPDGTVRYLKAYARVERNSAGIPHRMIGINYDITERKQTAAQIEASLKEKEVLLKEIHHRVKNNLGVVDGLLQMQSRRSQNPEVIETLKESHNRIASIALVHEKLYSSNDLAKINIAHYIADLTAHLFDSYNIHANQIKLMTHINAIPLAIDLAIPCGLIINELVSNALKYAFSNQQAGDIEVILDEQPDHSLCLIVRDNGVGFPEDFDLKQTTTLGMSLIQGLVKQLRGTLAIHSQSGTTVTVTFPRGQ